MNKYLVYLKYWTLNLKPIMVYTNVLPLQTLSSKRCVATACCCDTL